MATGVSKGAITSKIKHLKKNENERCSHIWENIENRENLVFVFNITFYAHRPKCYQMIARVHCMWNTGTQVR